jgi:hypothetical protein
MESYLPILVISLVLLSGAVALMAIKLFFRQEPALKGSCCQSSSGKYSVDRSAMKAEGGGCGCGGSCGCNDH